ncbi:hypothetical protein H6F42_13255 [Pseudanabaena sp. FACHB-1998]|uniref:hypothetical protein n=1 Tax=Pseudanabaena sp. FACHB-1998 TaxID=2692858 RepID=UPI001681B481|nr:hypothetical protein [Pseudanabaena sp. FACHB-1998]MBD2177881.1 hypothetical protein [Pseudanabaena sp. FACHB-1998]
MKTLLASIAAIGTMSAFAGSAIAEVSFNIRFGSSPEVKTYRTYRSYRSNVFNSPAIPYYQQRSYRNYDNNYGNSRVIVREVYPQVNYGNSWNYSTIPGPNYYYRSPRNNGGERYIVEKRIIRVR